MTLLLCGVAGCAAKSHPGPDDPIGESSQPAAAPNEETQAIAGQRAKAANEGKPATQAPDGGVFDEERRRPIPDIPRARRGSSSEGGESVGEAPPVAPPPPPPAEP